MIPIIKDPKIQFELYEITRDLERSGLAKLTTEKIENVSLWTCQFAFPVKDRCCGSQRLAEAVKTK